MSLEAASFPLVPFVNRIRSGVFTFRGREVRLEPNMAGDPSPLHGQGWLSPWRVESAGETGALLSFDHQPGEWPWEYQAEQQFALDEAGLSLILTCRNISEEPMPCGLGQHPYFNCSDATRIDTKVTHAWTIDEHVLPVAKVPANGRFDLRDRAVCGQGLDHGFGGWGGSTRMTDPAWPFDLELSSQMPASSISTRRRAAAFSPPSRSPTPMPRSTRRRRNGRSLACGAGAGRSDEPRYAARRTAQVNARLNRREAATIAAVRRSRRRG